MSSIEKLTELFGQFPGIGPRQSKRFVYFLLTRNNGFIKEFAELILGLKDEIIICSSCFRFFPKEKGASSLCSICRDNGRDESLLMIVARDIDVENVERSGSFHGLYFIIGGTIPILEKEPEKRVRAKELVSIIKEKIKSKKLKEIILAMNLNPEGENTADYIRRLLEPTTLAPKLKISTLGRGLSTGTELEYSDPETLKNALKNRA